MANEGNGLAGRARIDHAAGTAEVGLSLPPTELLSLLSAKGSIALAFFNTSSVNFDGALPLGWK